MLTDTSMSPYAKLSSIPLDAVRWTGGFWHEQFERCRDVMIPNMWRLLKDPDISHAYTNFLILANNKPGVHKGHPWGDADLYKWLEAVAAVYAVTKDEHLDQLMDEVIETISRAQRDDGYIHTSVQIRQQQSPGTVKEFEDRLEFETFNLGHLMTTACIHHRATSKDNLLDVAKKAADYLYHFCKKAAPQLARNAVCPSHYMGIIELYRTTRDPKYLELATNLIEIRNLVTDGTDDNQDRVPFRQQDRAVGHAVRANYLYAGVADVYAETGDVSLLATLQTLWTNVVQQKMYITGGCGALYDGASPDGSPNEEVIALVHQAYGREYQLPNVTAYNETCANLGNVLWNWRMLNITQEARFADVLELTLYNSALSGIGLDGKTFFYTNTLRQVDELPFELRMGRHREPYITCFCCPPNIVRTIAEIGGYAYSLSNDGLWVNLYGSNVLDTNLPNGSRIRLIQESNYPWDSQVKIVVDNSTTTPFALMLRIPGWSKETTVSINGRPTDETPVPGQYFRLERVWSSGETVELNLWMQPRLIEAHPMVEENRNQVAIMRGPLVYCLESLDLPTQVRPSEVIIPRDIKLRARVDETLSKPLTGITVLEGRAKLRPERYASNQPLYWEVPSGPLRDVEIKLIPYYAWDNRGKSEMTVWMPMTW